MITLHFGYSILNRQAIQETKTQASFIIALYNANRGFIPCALPPQTTVAAQRRGQRKGNMTPVSAVQRRTDTTSWALSQKRPFSIKPLAEICVSIPHHSKRSRTQSICTSLCHTCTTLQTLLLLQMCLDTYIFTVPSLLGTVLISRSESVVILL